MDTKLRRASWRGATAAALVGAVAFGGAVLPVLVDPMPAYAQAEESSEALCELVNPVLRSYVPSQGDAWRLEGNARLVISANESNLSNERLAEVVKLVNAEFADKGLVEQFMGMVYAPLDAVGPGDIAVDVVPVEEITSQTTSTEAYKIEISPTGGIRIFGASENAVMYGLRTIEAILQTNDGEVPAGTIVDWPDIQERRLFVDCGRKFFSKDWFIRQIHEMSYMKLNTMDMHFSENLGFRVECKTDPAIVSDEFLTHEDVLEILEEARLYGIKVIPSIDSPGHVDQILKVHPEYGQVANDGVTHYKSGLDVTNPEAVAYMKSIYKEYIDLFKQGGTTTDISIGCDEYMEFDRAPFTTHYKGVLDAWAKKNLGPEYQWTDTMATYINDLAEYCRDEGLQPRVFNDGIYYGAGGGQEQKVKTHEWIGVDFWSQMEWNGAIANLQELVDRGMGTIYNFNANYGYFVLRNNDRGASFDFDDSYERWWNQWRPGDFQSEWNANVLADDDPRIKGTAIAIWCDYPEVATEEEVMQGISKELRAMASRSWNVGCNKTMTLDEFTALTDELGHAAAWDKGEKLPDSGEILPAEDVGKVTVRYVDAEGNPVRSESVLYGLIGSAFSVDAPKVYGYRLVSEQETATGSYAKDPTEIVFVYELYTDRAELADELAYAPIASMSIEGTYEGVEDAIAAARAVFEDPEATQAEVDAAQQELAEAVSDVAPLSLYALYVETSQPLNEADYAGGYEAYRAALDAAVELMNAGSVSADDAAAALAAIRTAKDGLTKPTGDTPSVTATDGYYTEGYTAYRYENMLDGNPATKCWFNDNQNVGDEVVFTFPAAVNMSSVTVQNAANCGNDVIDGADIEVSATADGAWTTVGHMDNSKLDWTFDFPEQVVRRVRIRVTKEKRNWMQISEVTFASRPVAEDTTLATAIDAAEDLDLSGVSEDDAQALVTALITAQEALVSGRSDASAVEALKEATAQVGASDGSASDATALRALLDSVLDVQPDGYTAESWQAFDAARSNAAAVLEKDDLKQTELNGAHVALQEAYFHLVQDDAGQPDPDPETFTVTFDDLIEGTVNKTVEVAQGEKLDPAQIPASERAGYTFAGWYLDTDFTAQFDPEAKIEGDLTLYAKWEKKTTPTDPSGPDQGKPGQGGSEDGGGAGSGSGGKTLPKTGDPAVVGVVVGALGAAATALGVKVSRRKDD